MESSPRPSVSADEDVREDDEVSVTSTKTVDENNMSERQLRDLYDSEEIDRFLSLFSAYVNEVELQEENEPPNSPDSLWSMGTSAISLLQQGSQPSAEPNFVDGNDSSDPDDPQTPEVIVPSTFSERIAQNFLCPVLPPSKSTPTFTLGRLRLTTQRLYLATLPVYGPFLSNLARLATWENRYESSLFCSIFWLLWYYNLLLPALFFRMFYSLLRRKIFSYPTLAELKAHREEIDRADEFGQEFSTRFSASSSLGLKELWRLFKVFNKSKKSKAKKLATRAQNVASQESLQTLDESGEAAPTVLDSDDPKENVENDLKRVGLQVLSELADLHERIKNIFIWRRPASSKMYGSIILFLALFTLVVPAKYIAKTIYFVGGFMFWHLVPIIAALSPADRSRLPPPFMDVPTDAEYAMDLISQRVAAGLDVRPTKIRPRDKKEPNNEVDQEENFDAYQPSSQRKLDSNLKKLAHRAAVGKAWIQEGKRALSPSSDQPGARPHAIADAHTFPAQHSNAPGLITLTPDTLFFTPIFSSNSKIEIPVSALKGVKKKNGLMNALAITWTDGSAVDREEKFRWLTPSSKDPKVVRVTGASYTFSADICSIMFFSPELLAKRDSGFGLLWLAATLGAKSTFKRLPKRSVLTADIAQLCDLIAEPSEPLALRLSSNLMVGVARVYKVKQEIFYTDVTHCVTSLKKVVQEIQSAATSGTSMQMAQPTAKHSALTLSKDPRAAFLMDFDALVADWDEFLNIGNEADGDEDSGDEFDPKAKSGKAKPKSKLKAQPLPAEDARADMYTLKEPDLILSNSFDLSFHANGGEPSSSQFGGGFDMNDAFSGGADILDLGLDISDELAKELGEGWGTLPDQLNGMMIDDPFRNNELDVPMDIDFGVQDPFDIPFDPTPRNQSMPPATPRKRKQGDTERNKENLLPSNLRQTPNRGLSKSPAPTFSQQLLSQDREESQLPLQDITEQNREPGNRATKKVKKTRLLLDARTELTDEELKLARAEYLKGQTILRRELEQKKAEKDGAKILEELMWGVPRGLQAEPLVEFWQENFKVQVEARTGVVFLHPNDEPPRKRRKIRGEAIQEDADSDRPEDELRDRALEYGDFNINEMGLELDLGGSDRVSIDRADIRMRGSSQSRRESSLIPSQTGSVIDGLEFSPSAAKNADDDEFDVGHQGENSIDESQRSEMNLITLERNSFNFLEYVRMQQQGLPGTAKDLSFDGVVPMDTSTRHVAAAAFYHCLGKPMMPTPVSTVQHKLHSAGDEGFAASQAERAIRTAVDHDLRRRWSVLLKVLADNPDIELSSVSLRLLLSRRAYRRLPTFPLHRNPPFRTHMSSPAVLAAKAALASIDLSNYDPEQSRLMDERCILVDEDDNAIGAMDKKTWLVAPSVFRVRVPPSDGKLLLQQRATEKITFPDMWTNTCCSHPLDDFEIEKVEKEQLGVRAAASRKLEHELGIPTSQTPVDEFQYLTRIHYLAPSNGMWGEHEVDYILFFTADVTVTPNLNEIRDYKYVDKAELQAMFKDESNSFTPWFKLIARDFLFGWWDELLARKNAEGLVVAKSLAGVADGSKVFKM
ncbi:unnamed protein product [Mycena citricolor]|uniref:isopentenyl-diphosphate Delta-isomerase n=1 Tax=Mycena citricolor TaxID=2018698 RepID=A0AAD2HR14_9AGAR|nr:unnamed protein product [Mycena citricolor]